MKKTLFLMAVAFTAVVSVQAQLITWSVKPGVYSKIEPCWNDMYFVYKGNSVGVINDDGTVIVSPDASRITGFYEGYALVLKSDGEREKIIGILSGEGNYVPVAGSFYTIPNQEFFSEGFLTVTNSQGKAGYMDTKGVVDQKHQFDVTFATPFTEGYATVGEGEKFRIIDKNFGFLQITIGSKIYGGTGVFNGQAIVWDGDPVLYFFDVNNNRIVEIKDKNMKKTLKEITNEVEGNRIEWDYLGCFSKISHRLSTVSYDQPKRSSETISATEQGGKYGYVKNGKTILPCQFEQAENFHGRSAIVRSNGKAALLSLYDTNETFSANPTNSEITYKQKEAENLPHNFRIAIPSLWDIEKINARIKDENGAYIPTSDNEGLFEFKSDASEEERRFCVELESEGLKLWSGDITYNYKKLLPPPPPKPDGYLTVSVKAKNTQADKNNRCYIEATISNPNSEAITATVYFKGSNLLEAVSQRITVPAYGTKVISTYFTVTKAVSGQTVTVSTSAGGTATLDGLQLIPF